jgi:capsular exopolysaccharide synthesis family protein
MRGRLATMMRGQVVQRDRMSDVAEAYRTIRTGIFFGAATDTKTILITSAAPGEGKSTTASNLAIATAQAGHRTLLLDADFRKPVQHNTFEVDGSVGTADLIAGTVKLRDIIRRTNIDHLFVLPVGTLPSNPSEILAGKRFAQLMSALVAGFDRVIIDTPPVMSVTDARILAASADVTIMVVRTNKSTRKICSLAADSLRNVGANLIGVIVNDLPRNAKGYGYYGYSGYSYYGRRVDTVDAAPTAVQPNGADINGNGNGHATNGHAANGNGSNGHRQPALPQEAITLEP